jgi:hypothetical protein
MYASFVTVHSEQATGRNICMLLPPVHYALTLALTLFVARILADDPDNAFPPDYLALAAHCLD